MRFSVGLWDALFGEKVVLELTDPNGKLVKRRVSVKWLEKMEGLGAIKKIPGDMVRVHVLDPWSGVDLNNETDPDRVVQVLLDATQHYRIEHWAIGKDVSAEVVAKFKEPTTGDLYALVSYEEGKRSVHVIARWLWEKMKAEMDAR